MKFVLFFSLLTTCTVELYTVNRFINDYAQVFGGSGISAVLELLTKTTSKLI